jgi:hypothetical protein
MKQKQLKRKRKKRKRKMMKKRKKRKKKMMMRFVTTKFAEVRSWEKGQQRTDQHWVKPGQKQKFQTTPVDCSEFQDEKTRK